MISFSKWFQFQKNQTSFGTELLAGFTTYLTMCYIIFVNPNILHTTGMDLGAVFVATCLVTALGSFLIGVMSNYPVAIAPGMALNIYFSYVVVQALGLSWQDALGTVFVSGVIFLLLTLTKIRRLLIESVPDTLNIGISIGIGIFIALLALKSGDVIKANQNTIITLGNIKSASTLLFFLGFCTIVILEYHKILGSIIIGILGITLIGIVLGVNQFHGIFSLPPSIQPTLLKLNIKETLNIQGFSVIFAFLLVALFDSTGTLIGVLQQPEFTKDQKRTNRISLALVAESIATTAGSLLGTSSTSPFIESASGIGEGGRTGFTAIVVAILFLFSLFLSPLAATIPNYAVAPALLYIGVLMIKNVKYLECDDFSEFVPSILTAIMIPFTFSIADGLGFGIISYVLIKIFCGKYKDINIILIALSIIFILYFIIRPSL